MLRMAELNDVFGDRGLLRYYPFTAGMQGVEN